MSTQTLDWGEKPKIEEQTLGHFLNGLRVFWRLTATEHRRLKWGFAFLAAVQVAAFLPPLLLRELIDLLPSVQDSGITSHMMVLMGCMYGTNIAYIVLQRLGQQRLFIPVIIDLDKYWVVSAHKRLLELSLGYHERENTGKKIAKVTKGIEKLTAMLADIFWGLAPMVVNSTLYAIAICVMDPVLGFVFFMPMALSAWLYLRSHSRFYDTWLQIEKWKESGWGVFCQSISNVRTVQSSVAEEREFLAHQQIREKMRERDTWASFQMEMYSMLMQLLYRTAYVTMLIVGVARVIDGSTSIGTVAFVAITGGTLTNNFWGIMQVYTRMFRNLVAAERMQMLLDEPVDVRNHASGIIVENADGTLVLANVSHTYPNKEYPALSNINLIIEAGEMIALVGKSGSGKSTLVSLIARVYDPSEGMITILEQSIKCVDRDWYRSLFAYVPQEVELFEGTIAKNILYTNPTAPSNYIAKAVTAAALSEMISDTHRFPKGLETEVGERGVRLSGGERQRVGIARAYVALLCGAKILILDEATSSLDSISERVVQKFIQKIRDERSITIIAIAHRLSTIKNADRICVLENGTITEIGDHSKLLRKNGLYSHLVNLQKLGEVSGEILEGITL